MSDFCPLCGDPREICEAYGRCYPPAATGSGEPFPVCTECGKKVTVSWESHADECTPPASQPTVTLDRETFKAVEHALIAGADACWEGGKDFRYDMVVDALALLRAAEQK